MKNSTIYDYIKETEEDDYKRTAEFVKYLESRAEFLMTLKR